MCSTSQSQKNNDLALSDILKPVDIELLALEKKMIDSLSGTNELLNQISEHVLNAGGKRLRPAICFLIAKALNKGFVSSNHFQLGQGIELIHTATLIHDDIIDETDKRRTKETVNQKWDNKTALIAGDFLLSRALINLAAVKNNSVMQIFAKTMSEICEGEIEQNLQQFQLVSIDKYIKKSKKKTANLFIASAESAAILSPNSDNLIIKAAREYALNFGIAFQIIDDILNFTADEKIIGKPIGIDLRNGILTAPVIFAVKEYEENKNNSLKKLIETKFKNKKDFNKALDLVLKSNGINQSKILAQYYIDLAIESLSIIEDNIHKKALQALAYYILKRNS